MCECMRVPVWMCIWVSCYLATEKVRSANKNIELQAPFKCTELSSWSFCFSTLTLRLDSNKVPKAEDTKRWKVWPTGRLVMSSLWISLVYFMIWPPFVHFLLSISASWCLLLLCDCSSLICLNSPVCISSDFSQSFLKCRINTPLIRLITSWMNSNCQLILCGLPVSWLLLLQNINDRLSVALHSQGGYWSLIVFRGRMLEPDCYRH